MGQHGGQGRHRPGWWRVVTPGQTGPADQDGNRIRIPRRTTHFNSYKRARRFRGNVQGARLRFWTARRLGIAFVLIVAAWAIFCR